MEMLISLLPGLETKPTSRVPSHKQHTIKLKVAPCDAHWHGGAFKRHLGAAGPELKLATLCQNVGASVPD